MDRAKQREIASKGGKAAHQKGTAHEWTSEEARDAGRKGGIASHQRRREQGVQGEDEGAVGMNRDASSSSLSSSLSSSSNMNSERDSNSSDRGSSSTESRMPTERDE
jgi:hypothetical protein